MRCPSCYPSLCLVMGSSPFQRFRPDDTPAATTMPAVSDTFAAGEELAEAILAGERKALPRHTVAKDTRPRRQQQARGARFQQQLATPIDDAPYVMRVWVRGATGLPAADVDGTADPYVEVELSLADGSTTHSKRTSAIQDNRDPRWEPAEELTFYLHGRDVEQAILNIRVYDEDSAKNDDQIAVCECDVSEDLSGADRTRLNLPIAHPTEGRTLRDGATLELDLWLSPVQGDDQDEKVCYEAEVARQKLKHAAEVVLLDTDGFGHASSAAWYKVFKVSPQVRERTAVSSSHPPNRPHTSPRRFSTSTTAAASTRTSSSP